MPKKYSYSLVLLIIIKSLLVNISKKRCISLQSVKQILKCFKRRKNDYY